MSAVQTAMDVGGLNESELEELSSLAGQLRDGLRALVVRLKRIEEIPSKPYLDRQHGGFSKSTRSHHTGASPITRTITSVAHPIPPVLNQ